MDDLCGVILAAGAGQRIQPLSFAYPKPMLPVCNRPIAEHQLLQMTRLGIKDIYIVVGPMRQRIIDHFADGSKWGVRIHYVSQPSPQGIAHALSMTADIVRQPMLVFLGDIFFAPKNLHDAADLFFSRDAAAVLAVKEEPSAEMIKRNFSVETLGDGRVYRVVEKPTALPNNLKGCGLYFFKPIIFEAIRKTPPSSLRNECELTDAIQTLIDLEQPVYASDVINWDVNVTHARDLLDCNMRELQRMGVDHVIGHNVVLPEGTTLRRAVIGDKVVIPAPMTIEECVIFGNVAVDPRPSLRRSILLSVDIEILCNGERTDVIMLR